MITFVVIDSEINPAQSADAVATVFFTSVDNPPVLDLNGPTEPGRNDSTQYTEGSQSIAVSMNCAREVIGVAG